MKKVSHSDGEIRVMKLRSTFLSWSRDGTRNARLRMKTTAVVFLDSEAYVESKPEEAHGNISLGLSLAH
ncbi:hypothetical protein KM043_014104 [Ampulex compressa]|nr:hypothetical protein KM043_014104 [Ampulex compressa]